MYCNLESLLIKVANQEDFTQEFQKVTEFYKGDLNASNRLLSLPLKHQNSQIRLIQSLLVTALIIYEAYQKGVDSFLVKYAR